MLTSDCTERKCWFLLYESIFFTRNENQILSAQKYIMLEKLFFLNPWKFVNWYLITKILEVPRYFPPPNTRFGHGFIDARVFVLKTKQLWSVSSRLSETWDEGYKSLEKIKVHLIWKNQKNQKKINSSIWVQSSNVKYGSIILGEFFNYSKLDAYIADGITLQTIMTQSKDCHTLRIYIDNSTQTDVSFVYRKDLGIGALISQTILDIRESGELQNIYERWIYMPKCLTQNAEFSQFDVEYFGGIIFICGILLIVSIFLIVCENFYTHVRMSRTHKHENRARTVTTTTNISLESWME